MEADMAEAVALHRWAVIAEATAERLSPAERGVVVRRIAGQAHSHPDGSGRRYTRGTIDRWIRAWRAGGLDALRPSPARIPARCGPIRSWPSEAVALRLELPSRSAAQIASILFHRHGVAVSERTVRDQLRRRGLHREALEAEPKVFGRYEAARANERWITDVLVGPWVPHPKVDASVRAKLFLIVDDHSRLLVDGVFYAYENARACQEMLRRAIVRRGMPEVLYADNGAPFRNAWLARTCAVLGDPPGPLPALLARRPRQAGTTQPLHPRSVPLRGHPSRHRQPRGPQRPVRGLGRDGRQPAHSTPRPARAPIERFERGGPHRQADPDRLREAFRWSVTRKVTRTATVPLEGNHYAVDPSLVGRRVELRYDPEDLTRIDVLLRGPPGRGGHPVRDRTPHPSGRAPSRPARPAPTGVDYLGLVAAAHEEAAGTGTKIDFTQLAIFELPDSQEAAVSRAPWVAHFGLKRTPFGKSIPAKDLYARPAHQEAIARINFCVVENALGVITGDVGAGKTVSVRAAVSALDPTRHQIIYISNPAFGTRGLYVTIVEPSATSPATKSRADGPSRRPARRRSRRASPPSRAHRRRSPPP